MAVLLNKKLRVSVLGLILLWSVAFFWSLNQYYAVNIITSILALIVLLLIFFDISSLFVIIFISFIVSDVLYGYLYVNNLPLSLIMFAGFFLYGYLFLFLEQKLKILGRERLVYVPIFSLLILEMFLFLSYLLLSPINKSLLIALLVYIVSGFSANIIAKDNNRGFLNYLLVFAVIFVIMILTATWGG